MLISKYLNSSKLKKIIRTSNYLTEERDDKKYRLDKNENTHNQLFKKINENINQNDINSYPNFKKFYSIISKEEK